MSRFHTPGCFASGYLPTETERCENKHTLHHPSDMKMCEDVSESDHQDVTRDVSNLGAEPTAVESIIVQLLLLSAP